MICIGTRGTLKIYLNDELKVRQYNQWDSYPTGQFKNICEFFMIDDNLYNLIYRLKDIKLETKEQNAQLKELIKNGYKINDNTRLSFLWRFVLFDRDIGSDILNLIAYSPSALKILPDWAYWDCNDGRDDLQGEEGNYIIKIWFKGEKHELKRENIRFQLSGEYHGIEREFSENYIPGLDEIKEWEEENTD